MVGKGSTESLEANSWGARGSRSRNHAPTPSKARAAVPDPHQNGAELRWLKEVRAVGGDGSADAISAIAGSGSVVAGSKNEAPQHGQSPCTKAASEIGSPHCGQGRSCMRGPREQRKIEVHEKTQSGDAPISLAHGHIISLPRVSPRSASAFPHTGGTPLRSDALGRPRTTRL